MPVIPVKECSIFVCPDNGMAACLRVLTRALMLFDVIARKGYANALRESAMKVDCGRKYLAAPGTQTLVSIALGS